jgi:hypothetical protein
VKRCRGCVIEEVSLAAQYGEYGITSEYDLAFLCGW